MTASVGAKGPCPVCRVGQVERHQCDTCRTCFCADCHGIAREGLVQGSIGLCQCKVAIPEQTR